VYDSECIFFIHATPIQKGSNTAAALFTSFTADFFVVRQPSGSYVRHIFLVFSLPANSLALSPAYLSDY
jgi:hypothetical protein